MIGNLFYYAVMYFIYHNRRIWSLLREYFIEYIVREIKTMSNVREIKINHKYRHFKGKEYLVLHVAKDSETLEDLVVYQALYGEHGIWVRPLDMFLGQKEVNGEMINRFEEAE